MEILVRKAADDDAPLPPLLLPRMLERVAAIFRGKASSDNSDTSVGDCICWFAPEGIHAVDISGHDGDAFDSDQLSSSDEDQGRRKRIGALKRSQNGPLSRSRTASSNSSHGRRPRVALQNRPSTLCCDEWRGYRTAYPVLKHFEYSEIFVDGILQLLFLKLDQESSAALVTCVPPLHHATTPFVRGATIARPESYCLCVGKKGDRLMQPSSPKESRKHRLRRQERRRTQQRQHREHQREVFPRILISNLRKGCTFTDMDDDDNASGIPCVQFLNHQASHAVCMMTPPFSRPLPEPLTMILVAIAVEDGCFLSGLHHRFELGHSYPSSRLDDVTELSPICLAAEQWTPESNTVSSPMSIKKSQSSEDADNTISSDEMDDDEEESDKSDVKCGCIFRGAGEKIDELDDDNVQRLRRGRLGPGAWHVYTAVWDGARSRIRVDGVEDQVANDLDDEDYSFTAFLDGLTLGSDHCFGLSLCSGQGSGAEGSGAIAELAVFSGIFGDEDLQTLEQKIGSKHNIPFPDPHTMFAHNARRREGQALLMEHDAHLYVQGKVPLRYLTQSPIVAWKQHDPVTGVEVHIPRIGSRAGASSSDW